MTDDGSTDNPYGDAAILAGMDNLTRDFRESEKASKQQIVQHMVKLRHNLQYNKHLMSVYMKAKAIFDEIVEERRSQIHHLDEIYRHLSKIIHEELMKSKKTKHTQQPSEKKTSSLAMTELVKDKRKIGKLLSSMRKGLDKLMGIDTIIGTTIDKINEIEVSEDEEGGGGGDDVETEGTDDDGDMEYVNEDDDETEDDDTETDVNGEDEGTEDDLEYVDAPDEDEDDEEEGEDDEDDDEDEEEDDDREEEDDDREDDDEEDDDREEEDEDDEEDDDREDESEGENEEDDDSESDEKDDESVVFY